MASGGRRGGRHHDGRARLTCMGQRHASDLDGMRLEEDEDEDEDKHKDKDGDEDEDAVGEAELEVEHD